MTKHLRLKSLLFVLRLAGARMRLRSRLRIASLAVGIEAGVRIICDRSSAIRLGRWCYLARLTNLESYDGATLEIGDRVAVNKNCSIVARYGIEIGSDCKIGPNVNIYDHSHSFGGDGLISDQGYKGAGIRIGTNVWIGAGAYIGTGVTIGDNSVVGANAIVVKDVPGDSVVHNRTEVVIRKIN